MGKNGVALSVRGLTKQYGGRQVVSDLSFDLRYGESLGLLGKNGAGKTTTLRMLSALVRADAGTIRLLDRVVPEGFGELAGRVGVVIEQPALYGNLTARQNLIVAALQLGSRPILEELDHRLTLVGLEGTGGKRTRSFSTGMKGRLAIACALVGQPEVLILDEPTSGLDPIGRRELRQLLAELNNSGIAVLIASHELSEVELTCDRVVLLDEGRCVLAGTLEEVIGREEGTWVHVQDLARTSKVLEQFGRTQRDGDWLLVRGVTTQQVLRALAEVGIFPEDIRPATVTLEDVFVWATDKRLSNQ